MAGFCRHGGLGNAAFRTTYYLPFTIYSETIYHLPFTIYHLRFAIYDLFRKPFTIYHLRFTIYDYPFPKIVFPNSDATHSTVITAVMFAVSRSGLTSIMSTPAS